MVGRSVQPIPGIFCIYFGKKLLVNDLAETPTFPNLGYSGRISLSVEMQKSVSFLDWLLLVVASDFACMTEFETEMEMKSAGGGELGDSDQIPASSVQGHFFLDEHNWYLRQHDYVKTMDVLQPCSCSGPWGTTCPNTFSASQSRWKWVKIGETGRSDTADRKSRVF